MAWSAAFISHLQSIVLKLALISCGAMALWILLKRPNLIEMESSVFLLLKYIITDSIRKNCRVGREGCFECGGRYEVEMQVKRAGLTVEWEQKEE